MPRPFMAFGVLAVMAWAPLDPIGFAEAMRVYALVPEWLTGLLGGVAAFYFAARHLEKRLDAKSVAPAEVAQVMADVAALKAMGAPTPPPEAASMGDGDFRFAMSSPEPMPDGAIAEWNRRRKAGRH
ncbi:3TM-type holin [Pararhodospirillum photometricum]|uniref:Holin of 3TMs, for gene-transfer release n=1 Tax=Pararhodospirillum photometricum DSM 122 TaxID=1150469 RepID=H6SK67_PARPM|nr:3TM-type holin [Pararhodospirillum photometricum]CCG08382.1 Putative uncharacterized protein [Pararhodospirillum photometricum DSM 122]